jgi:hypothetical protein
MTTAWSHLPNAKYIDMILADLKANPDQWNAAYDAAWNARHDSAWKAAFDASRLAGNDSVWNAAYDAAWDTARGTAGGTARGAILALIAYDDCAYLLGENLEHVRILAILGESPAAVLLYPACLALQKEIV